LLLVAALLGAVALRDALPCKVADVRLDRTVVFALTFIRHAHVSASGLTLVAVGSSVNTAHRRIDLGATAPPAYALIQWASQDAFLADPAYGAVIVAIAYAVLRNALTGFANIPRSAIDERAQVHANTRWRRLGDAGVRTVIRPTVDTLTVVPRGAVAVVVALARVREALQALDELVCRREAALSVLLSLTRSLLVALIYGTPFARAPDVHSLFDAKVIAAAGAHTSFSGRLFTVPLVPDANAGARGLARVDVVAAVATTDRFEEARTIAASGPRNAPVCVGVRREVRRARACVPDEAIAGGLAMHRLITAAPVLDLMLATCSFLDRIGLAIFAADEPVSGNGVVAAGFTTTDDHHTDGANDHASQPKPSHCFSPRKGSSLFYRQLRCQRAWRKTAVISDAREYRGVPARARAASPVAKSSVLPGQAALQPGHAPFGRVLSLG
jgi:hypothetical protein